MHHKVLITGSTGTVGRHLCEFLANQGFQVWAGVRKNPDALKSQIALGDLGGDIISPTVALDFIVHCAGLAHQLTQKELKQYYRINVEGTRKLIDGCLSTGFKRFVFLSTIKVLGESSEKLPFTESEIPLPSDFYAESKWEAEQLVLKKSREEGFEAVIIRSPLVYGAENPKGNILALLNWMKKGLPLPFASLKNHRSMVHIDNLCSLIACCLIHPLAVGETFHVADVDFSTPGFLAWLARQQGIHPRFMVCPTWMLKALGCVLGRGEDMAKLTGSLQVSTEKVQKILNWAPIRIQDVILSHS